MLGHLSSKLEQGAQSTWQLCALLSTGSLVCIQGDRTREGCGMLWKNLFLTGVSTLSLRLPRSQALWKLLKFTSLVAPEQTKGCSYGRRSASVALWTVTVWAVVFSRCDVACCSKQCAVPSGYLEGNLYCSAFVYRESRRALSHQGYEMVRHIEGKSWVMRTPPPRTLQEFPRGAWERTWVWSWLCR